MLKTKTVMLPIMLLLTWPITHTAVAESGEDNTVQVQVNSTKDEASINTTVVIRENDEELRVVRHNGDVRVQINGEDVPEERIRFARGRLVILDDDGSELRTMRLLPGGTVVFEGNRVGGSVPPQPPRVFQRGPGGGGGPSGPGAGPTGPRFGGGGGLPGGPGAGPSRPWGSPPGPPRGQIGIGIGRIDAALAGHLQLDPDQVILVTHVREGAPAARAGLKPHDIIIKVDGESPVTHQRLREIVREKGPRETIAMTVLRAGDTHDITVQIKSAEPPRSRRLDTELGQRRLREHIDSLRDRAHEFSDGRWHERISELISEDQLQKWRERLLEDFEGAFNIDEWDQKTHEKAQRMAELAAERAKQFIERLEVDGERAKQFFERLEIDGENGSVLTRRFDFDFESIPGIEFFRGEDGTLKGVFTRSPDPPRPPRRSADIGRLEERLNRFERMLERIEQKLDRLAEQR